MNAIYIRFHAWRAFRLQTDEPELFLIVVPLGFASLFICRTCLIDARRKLRAAIVDRVEQDEAASKRGHGWKSDTTRFGGDDVEGR